MQTREARVRRDPLAGRLVARRERDHQLRSFASAGSRREESTQRHDRDQCRGSSQRPRPGPETRAGFDHARTVSAVLNGRRQTAHELVRAGEIDHGLAQLRLGRETQLEARALRLGELAVDPRDRQRHVLLADRARAWIRGRLHDERSPASNPLRPRHSRKLCSARKTRTCTVLRFAPVRATIVSVSSCSS